MPTRFRVLSACWVVLLLAAVVSAQAVHGVVVDQTGLPLPGVRLEVHRGGRSILTITSGPDGTFEVPGTDPGDIIEAALDGFRTARVAVANAARIVLEIASSEVTEVVASALTSSGAAMEHLGSTMSAPLAQRLPAPRPRILQSLPLLPAVVRGRDGQLRIGGTRPHESSLWIDGFDVTDPVTGITALDLPVESVKGMAVLRDPISATFSGVLGSLASIETATGGDAFRAGVQGFIPRPRLSGLGLGKIEAFFPRAYAGGRLGGHVRFFTSAEFNFERIPVPGVTTRSGSPSAGATGVTSFARVDVETSRRNTLTFEGMFAPFQQSSPGLSQLRAIAATPDVSTRDIFTGVVDRFVIGSHDLVTFRVGYVAHTTSFEAAGDGPARLTPDGWQDNWFSSVDHRGSRQSIAVTWDRAGITAAGTHTFSFIGDYRHRSMSATQSHQPIEIQSDAGRLLRRIDFERSGTIEAFEKLGGIGIRDVWDSNKRLQFDLGVRMDWSNAKVRPTGSPRIGLRYFLSADERTTLKASVGRFVGRAPLGALAFGELPARTDTSFNAVTGATIRRVVFQPTVGTLKLPYADGVALEVEHRFSPTLEGQASVRQRNGSDLPTVHVPLGGGPTELASTGTSRYREFQVSLRKTWTEDAQFFVSYVRSSLRGELNDFGTLFTSLDTPLLEPGGQATAAGDVPHRLRSWATFTLPRRVVISPSVEWRTGFVDSIQTLYRHYYGEPNSTRLPAQFAVDLTTFKTFDIGERKADLGLQLFNLTAHENPRDMYRVIGSARFGEVAQSFGITVAGYMQVRW